MKIDLTNVYSNLANVVALPSYSFMGEGDRIVDWKRIFTYGFLRRDAAVTGTELSQIKRNARLRKAFVVLNKLCDYWIHQSPILKGLNESLREWTTTDVDLVDLLTTTHYGCIRDKVKKVYSFLWGTASHAYGTERYREIILDKEFVEDSIVYDAGAAIILRHMLNQLAYSPRSFIRENWRVHKHSFEATIWTWLDDCIKYNHDELPYGSVTRAYLRSEFTREMGSLVQEVLTGMRLTQHQIKLHKGE